jgi:hypothetical protein
MTLEEYRNKKVRRIDLGIQSMVIAFTDDTVLKIESHDFIGWSDTRKYPSYAIERFDERPA